MYIMLNLMLLNSFMLIMLKHPLTCGLTLLFQTILIALTTGLMNINFWFSYIIFLIMVGGMMILFIYMTSIASNEKFKMNMFMLVLSMMYLMMTLILYSNQFYNMMEKIDVFTNNINFVLSFKKYMNYPNNIITMLMMIYLFISLIMVVKITNISHGPLRQNF